MTQEYSHPADRPPPRTVEDGAYEHQGTREISIPPPAGRNGTPQERFPVPRRSPRPVSALRDRRWTRVAALVLITGLLGCGLWMLRWSGTASTTTPDTFWYARDALRYAGHAPADADRTAAKITCGGISPEVTRSKLNYPQCVRYRTNLPTTAPERFQRIFTSRPGYPLLAVPFVRVMGPGGFIAATAAVGVACGVAVAVLALLIGLRLPQALMAETLFYLLPTGLWGTRLLAEAPMMLCLLVALIATVLLLRGRAVKSAAGLLAGALALCCAVKPANGVALAAALAGGAVLSLPRASSRRPFLLVAGIAMVVLAGNMWITSALHLPSVHETLQDTFTRHFRRPDVADPWPRLFAAMESMWAEAARTRMLDVPLVPAAFVSAAVGLFTRVHPDAAWPLALAGLTGAVVASVHPLIYEFDRLSVVAWVPVAFGLAALTARCSAPAPLAVTDRRPCRGAAGW